mmetsp:Transcript_1653/g.3646  ORF Transcript_1653/g.3646 Transcript_1653/m.3646 type:complete len:417 (-) Transcript_1653:585-1835(-)
MHDGCHSSLARLLHRIIPCKGEKCITSQHRPFNLIAGLFHRNLDGLHPVGLAASHTQQLPVLCQSDCIALYVLHAGPCKLQILELAIRGLLLRHDAELNVLGRQVIAVLIQVAASNLPERLRLGIVRLCLQDSQRLGLAFQSLEAFVGEAGGDDDFIKHPRLAVCWAPELPDLASELFGDGPVECDDAAKGAHGVGPHTGPVRFNQPSVAFAISGGGHSAGVGVLHDNAGCFVEVTHARVRRIRVQEIVEAHLFAVMLLRQGNAASTSLSQGLVHVEGSTLVWIFPVAQALHLLHWDCPLRWCSAIARAVLPKPLRHVGVIRGHVLESLPSQTPPQIILGRRRRQPVSIGTVEDGGVIRWVDNDENVLVVLCRGANHRWPADVDVFYRVLERDLVRGRHCRPERVQVADDDVNQTE